MEEGARRVGARGDRIARMRAAADFAIYTPGSSAGRRVSVLQAFAAPAESIRGDADLLRERVNSTVTGLLTLVGLDVDPLTSREHILLATILETAWRAGRNLDLSALIEQTQKPPVAKIGVVDIESFFPAKDRFALAMKLNNLLSAPGFAAWLEGEPLDVGALLHSPAGKPRISIFSIAHLDDSQRMFFVSLLPERDPLLDAHAIGATSLRAMLYMDEIFGYFPPVANPPSKLPLLTLLKQARAFGLGIVLATQNPVDLDYKGLANAGTWFLGRLQTERDKARVIEGLQGAAASARAQFDKQAIMHLLSGLKNRVFLMNNVHEDVPVVFQARWAMSYLCGPLARDQIKKLCDAQPCARRSAGNGVSAATSATPSNATASAAAQAPITAAASSDLTTQPPLVPPQIPQFFVPLRGAASAGARLVYQPTVLGLATVHFTDKKLAIDAQRPVCWLASFHATTGAIDWTTAQQVATHRRRPGKATGRPGLVRAAAGRGLECQEHDYLAKSLCRRSLPAVKSRPDEKPPRSTRFRSPTRRNEISAFVCSRRDASSATPCSRAARKIRTQAAQLEERIRRRNRKSARKERSPRRGVADDNLLRRDDPRRGARPQAIKRDHRAQARERSPRRRPVDEAIGRRHRGRGIGRVATGPASAARTRVAGRDHGGASEKRSAHRDVRDSSLRPKKADIAVRLDGAGLAPAMARRQWHRETSLGVTDGK